MEETKVMIPLLTFTELTVAAADCELLKRVLKERKKTYASISYEEIYNLCVMFGLLDEGEAQ